MGCPFHARRFCDAAKMVQERRFRVIIAWSKNCAVDWRSARRTERNRPGAERGDVKPTAGSGGAVFALLDVPVVCVAREGRVGGRKGLTATKWRQQEVLKRANVQVGRR